jgi:hypothetical protein
MAESLPSSKSLRAGLAAAGKPTGWDMQKRPVKPGYPPGDVRMHCVENINWQVVRKSLKGKDTVDKILTLEKWWDFQVNEAYGIRMQTEQLPEKAADNVRRCEALLWANEVQVGNYLGALRRGGQLDNDNQIRKAR